MRKTIMLAVFAMTGIQPLSAAQAQATPSDVAVFGKCLVSADRSAALTLFATLPPSSDMVDLSRHAECAKNATSAQAMLVRGGIAEALYERDFREAWMQPRRVPYALAQLNLPTGDADADGSFRLGNCVARLAASDIDKLLAASPGSGREGTIIERLMAQFSACQPKGTSVALKRSHLRALLAQTTYDVQTRYWQSPNPATKAN